MTNTNCLEGMRCPNCGQEDRFKIQGTCMFDVTDNGSEACGNHEFNGESYCQCTECDRYGKLAEFRISNQPKKEEENATNY